MELIFCYNFLTSYLVCVCPSKMIQMACKLGTFNAYEKKKKSLLRPFSSLFPLPTSNRIISFFNIIVSSIYPIQGWWYSFNKKGWNTSLFIYLWYRLLALKTREIILIVLITARKAHCCRNVDSRLFDSFLFFSNIIASIPWGFERIKLAPAPQLYNNLMPKVSPVTLPFETMWKRLHLQKFELHFNFTLGWHDEVSQALSLEKP